MSFFKNPAHVGRCARKHLRFFHFFVGIGAMAGGLSAIIKPDGPMGMDTAALVNAPFKDFMIPGLFLFFVLGVGNVFCGLFMKRKSRLQGWMSGFLACVLMAWILIQCFMLWAVAALHVLFFLIGAWQGISALALLLVERDITRTGF